MKDIGRLYSGVTAVWVKWAKRGSGQVRGRSVNGEGVNGEGGQLRRGVGLNERAWAGVGRGVRVTIRSRWEVQVEEETWRLPGHFRLRRGAPARQPAVETGRGHGQIPSHRLEQRLGAHQPCLCKRALAVLRTPHEAAARPATARQRIHCIVTPVADLG